MMSNGRNFWFVICNFISFIRFCGCNICTYDNIWIMLDIVIKELIKLDLDNTTKYPVTKSDMRNFCIQLLRFIKKEKDISIKSTEINNLIDANVKLMDKYKETFYEKKYCKNERIK